MVSGAGQRKRRTLARAMDGIHRRSLVGDSQWPKLRAHVQQDVTNSKDQEDHQQHITASGASVTAFFLHLYCFFAVPVYHFS